MMLHVEAWVEIAAETSLTGVAEIQVRGRKTLVDCVKCKDEEKQAVNQLVLLHNDGAMMVLRELTPLKGGLVLSCGEFLHLPGCFRIYFQL